MPTAGWWMNPSSLRTEIQNLLDIFLEFDVAIYANLVVKRVHKGGMTRVTWGSPASAVLGELF